MTKISEIKSFIVWEGHRNLFVLKVESEDGSYGWGESGLSGRELAVHGIVKHFREWLIGKDSRNIGAIWQEMYRGQYFEGGRVITAAISAIDIALHDLNARRLGVPVYQILGGKHRDFIPCFVTSTIPPGEGIIEDVQKLLDDGWKTIRTGIGNPEGSDPLVFEPRESIAVTSEWLDKLRSAIGREPTLGIDYHHRLSVAEAASFCNSMPRGTLDFLEEPIRDESPEAYESLRSMTDVPFAIGEEMSSKWQYLPYIERGLTQFARLDICNIGGFTEAMKVAGWCETHYIDLMPHNPLGPVSTAACIQLGAATPNFAWLEERSPEPGFRFNPDLFINQPVLEGVWHRVKDEPGLGIEFNEEIALAQTFEFWEAPHLIRRDGSHTNW
ncbi:MAG: galactonate dehydratase [Chloroflexi bacterium]|nr:galactonate dehydratase [Chloroflexota bacterium]